MKKTRIIALLLCVVMLLTTLTGCGKKTVMTINGEKIPEGIYTYFYSYYYVSAMSAGQDMAAEDLASAAIGQIAQQVAIKDLIKQLKIELTPMENKEIIDTREAAIEEMTRAVYASMLKAMNMTEKQYEEMDKTNYLYNKLAQYYYGEGGAEAPTDEDLIADFSSKYIRASHILLSTQEAESDADRAAIKAKAEEVLAKAKAGEDFADLIREYGEDPGLAEYPEIGYYFTTGQMVAEFETAAFELEENAISELVETSYGYHIIKRLPLDEAYASAAALTEDYYNAYCSNLLMQKLMAHADSFEIELSEEISKVDITNAMMFWMGY